MASNHRLKQARELRGWSQAKVAEQIGTDATTVSRWERGLFSPTPYFRERLCLLFDKNAEELGLMESANQPLESDRSNLSLQPPIALPSLHANEGWQKEDLHTGTVIPPIPPSWPKRTDTFTYILHSAVHDQQAHLLWEDAYVRALHGQRMEAQQLGEASLSAFERVGHLNAAAIREWLNQRDLTSPPSPPTGAPPTSLPVHPEQRNLSVKQTIRRRGAGIALILMVATAFILAGFSLSQIYSTASTSTSVAHASSAPKRADQVTLPARAAGNPALAPSPTFASLSTPVPGSSLALTPRVTPGSLTPPNCFLESLGYRCDLHLWLFTNGSQGSFTWQISSASTIILVHSPLKGTGTAGQSTQITIYILPEQKGQIIFTFTFASLVSPLSVRWEG
jgi:transcriptional regulator with XRE-family HTH domain